ncbi:MAG: hypothetical protein ACT4PT_12790 [Methanobacteriota archaeon]
MLATAFFVSLAASAAARPSPVCTDLKGNSWTCPGIVCVDKDLDAQWDRGECVVIYCLHYCCPPYGTQTMCPPPMD